MEITVPNDKFSSLKIYSMVYGPDGKLYEIVRCHGGMITLRRVG